MENEILNDIIESSTVAQAVALVDHEMLVMAARGEEPRIPQAAAGAVLAIVTALEIRGYSIEDSLLMLKNISEMPVVELEAD